MAFQTSWIAMWASKKELKKERFLKEMLEVMPWESMVTLLESKYAGRKKWWRAKTDLFLMLKIYCLQQRFNLSDPWVEEEIYDRVTFQRFLDIDLLNDNIPDETTILNFRHFLEKHQFQNKLFELINDYLEKKWMIMRKWTLVDATIITASGSTKNQAGKRDQEMRSTKKWGNYYHWMKVHIWVDGDTWVVHTVTHTSANRHDSTQTDDLLHWEEGYISWDKAYGSKARKQQAREMGIVYGMLDKAPRWSKLSNKQEKRNKKRQRVKAKVEHPFQVVKHLRWHRKVRYRWLMKNWLQFTMLMWLANIYKMRKKILVV